MPPRTTVRRSDPGGRPSGATLSWLAGGAQAYRPTNTLSSAEVLPGMPILRSSVRCLWCSERAASCKAVTQPSVFSVHSAAISSSMSRSSICPNNARFLTA